MDDGKDGKTLSKEQQGEELSDEHAKRSVLISNIPKGTKRDDLYIYFQRTANGGGEIEDLKILSDGKAILIYDEAKVAESVLQKQHKFGDVMLQLQPYTKKEMVTGKMDVFSLVSAKINPQVFNMSSEEIKQALSKIAQETKIDYIELCDGFWVSGSYEQIKVTCLKLSALATPIGARSNDVSSNSHDGRQQDHVVLDVQPKLMHILRNDLEEIKGKYKIKVDRKGDKVKLSPIDDDWESFESGKEEFITLYQKTFQQMDEKSFELKADDTNVKKLAKEIMEDLDVVTECNDKTVCIYGRSEHVAQAMQRLQGKPKRSRRACKPSNDVLPKPDTFSPLQQVLSHQLENGVTVTVYQGDITKQEVDVIVNAANECLEHGGGVAGAIVKQGGFQIQQESRQLVHQYGKVPVGKVARTGPGSLRCKMIFHAVGPRWSVHGPQGSRERIFNACFQSFSDASYLGFKSIVLPAISSGIFGVPKEICAEVLFYAAEMFSCEASSQNQLRDIRFVNIDSPTNDAFRNEFHKRYVDKQLDNDRKQTPNDTHPASVSNLSGNIKEPLFSNDKGKEKPDDHAPSNVASSKGVSRENNIIYPPSYAAAAAGAAAIKRAEQSKDVTNETLLQNEFKDTSSGSSFTNGFQSRQTTTKREDKKEGKTSPQEPKHREMKGVPSDGKLDTGSKVPGDHKTSVTNDSSQGRGREKQLKKNPNGSAVKTLGRGRGAMVHAKSNLAANFHSPGHAERVPSSEQPSGKSSSNFSDSSAEKAASKSLSAHSSNDEHDSQTEKPQRPSPLDANDNWQHEHEKKEQHVTGPPGTAPPGLDVSPEGLNLAAKCKFEGTENSTSLPQPADNQQEENMNEHGMKRKNQEDPPERSPAKLRKEDLHESEGLSDKDEQREEYTKDQEQSSVDDSKEQEGMKDQEQSGNDVSTKQDEDTEDQKQSSADARTKQENKIDQEQSSGDDSIKKQDKEDQEQSSGDDNIKQQDKEDQEQSSGDDNIKQQDKEDQEQSSGDDSIEKEEKKDQEQTVAGDRIKKEDKKDQEQSSGDDSTKQEDMKDQEQSSAPKGTSETKKDVQVEHRDKDRKGNEYSAERRDIQNHEESKDGPLSCDQDEKRNNSATATHTNDLDLITEPENYTSMDSFVILNIEDEQQQINRTNSVDDQADGSSSSESIVVVDAPDECQTNDESQSDNSSQPISTIHNNVNEQTEGNQQAGEANKAAGEANEANSVIEKTKNRKEAFVNTDDIEKKRETNENTSDSCRGAQTKETNLTGQQSSPESEKQSEKIVSRNESKVESAVDDLADMMQGLSTSDDNSVRDENPVNKTAPPTATECGLCKTAITSDNPKVILSGCGHVICQQCTGRFNDHKSSICPTCEKKAGCNAYAIQPPNGQMKHGTMDSNPLPGFDDNKTIYIDYTFPGGIQGSCHPNPGHSYDSLKRRTFLPDTTEGQEVLKLLQEAFEAGLLFTVGTCTINSKENQIIFSDVVDHKVNLKGKCAGYPDSNYLGRAKEKLKLALKHESSPPPPSPDA